MDEKGEKFVTADLGGKIDCFLNKKSLFNMNLKKGDYLFVCGDFSYIWKPQSVWEKKYIDIIAKRKYTTCFVDGNHENFDALEAYPITIWNGGKVHVIKSIDGKPKIIHLIRGEYYSIDGETIFVFGGGNSIDKNKRKKGINWWKQEMPNNDEMKNGLENLMKNGWKVDYILTHTCPKELMDINDLHNVEDEAELNYYLNIIYKMTNYKHWYSGHLSIKKDENNYTFLNNNLRKMSSNKEIIGRKIEEEFGSEN